MTSAIKNEYDLTVERLLCLALDTAEGMLKCGAEINRVENTVERICKAYGAEHVEVFSITSLILAAIRMPNGSYSSQMRRIKGTENNMMRLELYNSVSRRICSETPPLSEFEKMLTEAKSKRSYPLWLVTIAAMAAAGGFAVFFGGTVFDAISAALIGCIIHLVEKGALMKINRMVKTAISSFIGGMLSCLSVLIGFGDNAGIIMTGTLMLLVPGIAFGTALRNLLWGDILSGTLEIVRAALTAFMIALGYMLAMFILKGTFVPSFAPPIPIVQFIALGVAVLGFAVIFSTAPLRLPFAVIGGEVTFAIYFMCEKLSLGVFVCAFAASAFAVFYSESVARLGKAPAIVFLLSCVVTIVPGGSLYNAMSGFLIKDNSIAFSYLGISVGIGLGMACGIAIGSIIFGTYEGIRNKILNRLK